VAYWLVKSEPDECGIDDFVAATQPIRWDGVRNYQARNFLRDMQEGDLVLLYHSSCAQIGLAGVIEVSRDAYADPTQFDPNSRYYDPKSSPENPRWSAVDLTFVQKFQDIVPLATMKAMPKLEGLLLINKGGRLSVMPVSQEHWDILLAAAV